MSININPWEGSIEHTQSIGYVLNQCETTEHTGTFVGGSTVSFDTGLGDAIKYLVILDESAPAFPKMNTENIEGVYFLTYDVELATGTTIFSMLCTSRISDKTAFNTTVFPRAKSISFENGVFEYVPNFDNNALYNNFLPNHTYRWFAW
jgi:hypothetical protein